MSITHHYMADMLRVVYEAVYADGATGLPHSSSKGSKEVSQTLTENTHGSVAGTNTDSPSIHSRMHLPTVVMDVCFDYLPPRNSLYIDKARTAIASETLRRAFVARWYPPHILDVLGGIDKCVRDYTFFKGTRSIIGGTDYIDRVRLCDLPKPRASVYLAVDPYRRPMAVLRYWCVAAPTSTPIHDTDSDEDNDFPETITARQYRRAEIPHEVVVTLFQRYTDSTRTWCFGTCYGLERMPGDTYARAEALTKVKRMLAGETVTVGYEDWLALQVNRPSTGATNDAHASHTPVDLSR